MIQLTTASAVAITSLLSTQNVYAEEVSSEETTIFELTKPTTIQTSEDITITGATHLERWLKYRMLQGDQYRDYDKVMQQPELQGIFPEDSYIQDQEKTYDGYPIFTPQYYYDAETLKANLKAMRTFVKHDDIRVVINNKDYYVNPSRAVSAKNDANIWGGYLLISEMDRFTMTGTGNDIDGDQKKLRSKLEFYNKKKQILDGDIIPALSKYLIKHNALTKGSHQYVFRVDNHVVFAQNLTPTKLKKQLAKHYPKMKNIRIQLDPNYMKVSYKI